MEKEEIKYCRECGFKLEEHSMRRYNIFTGERLKSKHCPNSKCQDGCGFLTNHNNWSAWRNTCRDCGYTQIDY